MNKKVKKILNKIKFRTWFGLILLIVLIVFVVIKLWAGSKNAEAEWFNKDWGFRQTVTITNNGSAATNYSIEVSVDTKTLITAGKLQSNCNDIIFTSVSGTVLPYFIDYCSNTTNVNSSFFVKVDSAPAGTSTIYMYYGNPRVTANSVSFNSVGYPSGIVLGTGADGTRTASSSTNLNTSGLTGRTCSDNGTNVDAPYYSVTENRAAGTNQIVLSTTPGAGCLNAGDEVLIINLRGSLGDAATAVGLYEFARITSIATATLTLNHTLVNGYDGTTKKIMVERVPNYSGVTINTGVTLNAANWDGTKGGVLAFRSTGTVAVNGTGQINMAGAGYKGGAAPAAGNGGLTGESYDGASSGTGGNGASNGQTRGGGKSGDGGTGNPADSGVATGGGGGGGSDGSTNTTTGGGGGGGGGGYAGGGGGGGGSSDANAGNPAQNSGAGGTGGTVGVQAGGGGGGCADTDTANTPGAGGAAGGAAGTAVNCGTANGSRGTAATGGTNAGGGGGSAASGGGGGGGGGGFYGNTSLSQIYLGSGGGSGGVAAGAIASNAGGNGGGIIIISAPTITVNNSGSPAVITAAGNQSTTPAAGGIGAGGGGAGGSILINASTATLCTTNTNCVATGGAPISPGIRISGGGGGGDGRVTVNYSTTTGSTSPASTATAIPSASSPASEQIGASPVLYYKFDDKLGTSTFTTSDSSINLNTGTLGGTTIPSWQTEDFCANGKCYFFDGSTSKVTGSSIVNSVSSIAFWIKPNTIATQGIMNLDGGTHKISTDASGNVTATGFTSPTYYLNGVSVSTLTLVQNQWNYVVITTGTTFNTTSSFTIGTDGTNFIKGFIDDVKFFNYVRTASQVKTDYIQDAGGSGSGSVQGFQNQSYLSNGLIAYWRMEEASWNGTAGEVKDSSGNAINGTAAGTPPTTGVGKFGRGGSFNGTTDFINLGNNINLSGNTPMTISAWINPTSFPGVGNTLVVSKYDSGVAGEWYLGVNAGSHVAFERECGGFGTSGINPLSTGTWQLITGVYDGTNLYLYINGQLDKTKVDSCSISSTTENAAIGAGASGASSSQQNFNGKIDDVRIYKRALSPQEVANLYNFAPGPIGYWKLDENTGSTTYDSSTNGNNGSFVSGPTWTTGRLGNALNFSRGSAHVNVPYTSTFSLPGDISIGLWVKTAIALDSNFNVLFSKDNVGDTIEDFNLFIAASSGRVEVSSNGSSIVVGPVISDTNWHYVEYTKSGTTGTIYLDGVLSATGTVLAALPNDTFDINIGFDNGSSNFNGVLDDVRLYNYARTPRQVIEDMNNGHPTGGSPVGTQTVYWKFDEGYGTNAHNSVQNQSTYNGTINGTTWKIAASCKVNSCLNFGTSTDYVSAGSATFLDGLTGFTTTFWINPNTLATSKGIVSRSDFNAATHSQFAVTTDNTTSSEIRVYIASATNDAGSNYFTTSGLGLANGTWAHIEVVYDGTQAAANRVKVYKNGVLISGSVTGTIPAALDSGSAANLKAGSTDDTTNHTALNAILDEVKVYPSALSLSQVLVDFNSGASSNYGTSAGLESAQIPNGTGNPPFAYWNFNENTGTTVNDVSGNGNTGTLTGSTVNRWVSGIYGSAGGFGGPTPNDLVTTSNGNSVKGLTTVTIEAWIYPTAYNASISEIYFEPTTVAAGSLTRFELVLNPTGTVGIDGRATGNDTGVDTIWITSSGSAPLNQWSFITGVYTNTKQTICINARCESATATFTGFNNANPGFVPDIGGESDGSTNDYTGRIDELKLFNYAKTQDQISYAYNRGRPAGWWKFDENQGATANDSSGNSNTGTLQASPTWVSGKFNYAVNLNGSTQFITTSAFSPLAPAGQTTTSFSWGGWFNPQATPTSMSLMEKASEFQITTDSAGTPNAICGIFYSAAFHNATSVTAPLTNSSWNHVFCTYDGANIKTYVNGILKNTTVNTNAVTTASSIFYMGESSGGTGRFNGYIDDFRIYNYALSLTQIQDIYNNGSSAFYGPATGSP